MLVQFVVLPLAYPLHALHINWPNSMMAL